MIRGARVMAVAARRPDGSIALRAERLGGLYATPLGRIPLLRGVLVLWQTLALGMRALTWSSAVASGDAEAEEGASRRRGAPEVVAMAFPIAIAGGVFFLAPALATMWLDRFLGQAGATVIEGLARAGLLVGYLWAIGRSDDVRRVFQYHGAEHMAIHALEHDRELTVPAVRRFSREHPRCGTSFLLTVAVMSVVVFVPLGGGELWWRIVSRLALIPLVAAIAYEAIRFAGRHSSRPVIRWLFSLNLLLQRLTTREPDDEQIRVAVTALEHCIAEEQRLS